MTVMKVLLIVIAVILILLMCPLKVFLDYDGDLKLNLGYLFLKFQLVPPKPKKEKKKKTEEKKEKKPEQEKKQEEKRPGTFQRLMNKHGIDGLIDILKEVVSIVVDFLRDFAKHLYVTRCNIRICVVGDDAADTAIKYGYVCSAVYPLLSVLEQNSVLKKHSTDISAGFLAEKTAAEMELTFKIRLLFLLGAVFRAAFRGIKVLVKL